MKPLDQIKARLAFGVKRFKNNPHHSQETHIRVRGIYDGAKAENKRLQPDIARLILAVECAERALAKIEDPRLRDHKEPDAYTQLGCVMHMAGEARAEIKRLLCEDCDMQGGLK